jgi:hypothetical protein
MLVKNRNIYWIPIIGMLVSLMHYSDDNGMDYGWNYYQAVSLMALIAILTLLFAY